MDSEKKIKTEAELQIEKLLHLKNEREKREQEKLLHKTIKPIKSFNPALYRQAPNYIRIEKKLFEKIHKIVKEIKKNKKENISQTKFINNVLKAFIELNIDFSITTEFQRLKEILKKLETNK